MPNKRLRPSLKRRSNNRRSIKYKKSKIQSRKNKTYKRNQRGGLPTLTSLTDALLTRSPYYSSVPANYLQNSGLSGSGSTYVAPSPAPTSPSFVYANKGIDGIINPGKISIIDNSFAQLASPSPWQSYPNSGQPFPRPIDSTTTAAASVGKLVQDVIPKAIK